MHTNGTVHVCKVHEVQPSADRLFRKFGFIQFGLDVDVYCSTYVRTYVLPWSGVDTCLQQIHMLCVGCVTEGVVLKKKTINANVRIVIKYYLESGVILFVSENKFSIIYICAMLDLREGLPDYSSI